MPRARCFVRFRYKITGLKDLAFALSVPPDPAFRPLAAEAAGKYGETLGLPEQEAGALTVSTREAVELAAGAGGGGDVSLEVSRDGDHLEVTVRGGHESSTLSRSLAAARST
jgi:anti-sigma regulatory factor (Ser/Thr protein kinase)